MKAWVTTQEGVRSCPRGSGGQWGWEVQGMVLMCRRVLREQVWRLSGAAMAGEQPCCGITPTSAVKARLARPVYLPSAHVELTF